MKSDLFRQRQFLEKCLSHLRMRYSADSQKEPSHQKIIEENNYLIEKINTLRREVEINRTKYKELECVKKRTEKKKSPSKIIRKSVVEEPTKQVREHKWVRKKKTKFILNIT